MAKITKQLRQAHGLAADLIPAEVLKSIDDGELWDRLVHVAELTKRARNATDPTLRRGYSAVAKATLTARPRAEVARQHAELVAKAAGCQNGAQADAIRRQAERLLEEHPPSPRRGESVAVAKAKANAGDSDGDSLLVCFDENGRPFGVCHPDALRPVSRPADLAKVAKAGKAPRPATAPRQPGRR